MRKLTVAFGLLASMAFSSATFACDKPEAPAIPNGEAASGSDMLAAKKAVEAYLEAAESYLECARGNIQKDRMIADMEDLADQFNRELREYKAKS